MKMKPCSVLLIAGVLALYSPTGRAWEQEGGPDKKDDTKKKKKKKKDGGPDKKSNPLD